MKKYYMVAFIKGGIGQANLVEAGSVEMAEEIFKNKTPEAVVCKVREATESECRKPGIPILRNWKKTDDFQYCRKLDKGVYELIQACYIEDSKYAIQRAAVIRLEDYLDQEGNYTNEIVDIVNSYYNSADRFKEQVADPDTREQYLAEMIYETESEFLSGYDLVSEKQADTILSNYIATGNYSEIKFPYLETLEEFEELKAKVPDMFDKLEEEMRWYEEEATDEDIGNEGEHLSRFLVCVYGAGESIHDWLEEC